MAIAEDIRSRYAEQFPASKYPDAFLNTIGMIAQRIIDGLSMSHIDEAVILLTAHIAVIEKEKLTDTGKKAIVQTGGELTALQMIQLRTEYQPMADMNNHSFYTRTIYGQLLYALMNTELAACII